jgi:hypothetical protein
VIELARGIADLQAVERDTGVPKRLDEIDEPCRHFEGPQPGDLQPPEGR